MIFGTFNCVGSRKIHWLVACRARFMYMEECQAQIYSCCYKRKIRRCLTQGFNSPPSSDVNENSIYRVTTKSGVLIWAEFIPKGMGRARAELAYTMKKNYWFHHVSHRELICLVHRGPNGDAFKALLAESSMELKPVSM